MQKKNQKGRYITITLTLKSFSLVNIEILTGAHNKKKHKMHNSMKNKTASLISIEKSDSKRSYNPTYKNLIHGLIFDRISSC